MKTAVCSCGIPNVATHRFLIHVATFTVEVTEIQL